MKTPAIPKLRILLVDDHFVVRLGLVDLLSTEPDFDVVGEAADGEEAVRMFLDLRPAVVVMDFELPKLDGPEAVAAIRLQDPAACILMLTVSDAEESVWRAVQAGASGYALKSSRREDLVAAVRTVGSGAEYFPAGIAAKLSARSSRPTLSPREYDVLGCLVRGLANKEIADFLGLAEPTIKMHLVSVFEKLGARDRTQAAMLAVKRGLLSAGK